LWRHALLWQRHDSANPLTIDFHDGVSHPRHHIHFLGRPAEELSVEVFGSIGVRRHQLTPTEYAVLFELLLHK
jgi:hypothetical protein